MLALVCYILMWYTDNFTTAHKDVTPLPTVQPSECDGKALGIGTTSVI